MSLRALMRHANRRLELGGEAEARENAALAMGLVVRGMRAVEIFSGLTP